MKALNKGGSIEHFTIENLPSWLEAEPASGTIDPTSSADIVSTIRPESEHWYVRRDSLSAWRQQRGGGSAAHR